MVSRQFDQARRYFAKATAMEPNFAEAWVAFGHAFAALDESDQVPGIWVPIIACLPVLRAGAFRPPLS